MKQLVLVKESDFSIRFISGWLSNEKLYQFRFLKIMFFREGGAELKQSSL